MSARSRVPAAIPLRGVLARWDALAIQWGLGSEERSELLGSVGTGPVGDPATYDPAAAETRMRLLVALGPILAAIHADEESTRAWLRRPNVQLGRRTPLQTMARSPEWIRWLIDAVGVAA